MNLFWSTRHLTKAREDHLTCFLAATLEADPAFRAAYESRVLSLLGVDGASPKIASVHVEPKFGKQRCRPDMMLLLADGRRVLCEHKIDAPETVLIAGETQLVKQIERYLELPDIAAVAFFRSAFSELAHKVLAHPLYLHPANAPHFLWRDLYEPLALGEHELSKWLRDGFERLGFTPPAPHVGELRPDDSELVKQNQRNFTKLWDSTRRHLRPNWKVHPGRRCELYLKPRGAALASRVHITPLAQGGSLLRVRAEIDESASAKARERLKAAAELLPLKPEISSGRLPNGRPKVDVFAPLYLVLGVRTDAMEHEERLFQQVVPLVDALLEGESAVGLGGR